MEWVNYQHLLYFYTVAKEGSLARASSNLRLAQSTISKQIHQLEHVLGHHLFVKSGRRLVLSDSGRLAFRYAEEIFGLGMEMMDTFKDRPIGKPIRITVGIADVVPKLIAERVLMPILETPRTYRLICKEGKPEQLLVSLAMHELDVVLMDAPSSTNTRVRVFSHLLAESTVTFFGSTELAAKYRQDFPKSLAQAPILMPTNNTVLRRTLEQWFDQKGIRPDVVCEFEDSALLKAFGRRGVGLFPAATAISNDIVSQYKVEPVGEAIGVFEHLYAVTVDRKIQNPAVAAMRESAQKMNKEPSFSK
jgi:LysR family transcriptional activator of nhaA